MRRDRGQKLNDNRRRDIRHDVEGEDRHAPDRAAREHVEHAEDARLLLPEDVGERLGIDAGDGDVGSEPVDQERAEREPDALLELVGFGEGRQIEVGNELFCRRNHRNLLPLARRRSIAASPHSDSFFAGLAFGALASPSAGFSGAGLALGEASSSPSASSPLALRPLGAAFAARFAALRSALILSASGLSRPVIDLSVTVPPLASTALIALCEAPVTSKASFALSSPLPRRRTPSSSRRMRPASFSAATVIGFLPSSRPASTACWMRPRLSSFSFLAKMLLKPRLGRRRCRGIWPPSKPLMATPARAF